MTDHEHDHDHEHGPYDWEGELLSLRAQAAHYYEHGFDWRGHEPPPGFTGPRFYPPAPEWRMDATLDTAAPGTGEQVQIATSTGKLRDMEIAGQLVFESGGAEHRLTAFKSHDVQGYEVLFVPFRDATSGSETYGAGRYVEAPLSREEGTVELDFNYAYNPSCVFSPAYDCPYPPPQNRLSIPVRAGEMLPYDKPAD